MKKSEIMKKFVEQRLLGVALIVITLVVTIMEHDCTSLIMFGSLGAWLIGSKKILIY